MLEYLNAVCAVCGRKYHVCNDCKSTRTFAPWRTIADSVNCYRIYLILQDYHNGYLDGGAARERLSGCDLSEIETYAEHIRMAVWEILGTGDGQVADRSR